MNIRTLLSFLLFAKICFASGDPFSTPKEGITGEAMVDPFSESFNSPNAKENKKSINVFLFSRTKEQLKTEGILVEIKNVEFKEEEILFSLQVVNYHKEEVFVEIVESGGFSFVLKSESGGSGGAGTSIGFPDNTRPLKRLHRAFEDNESNLSTCGCAVAIMKGSIPNLTNLQEFMIGFYLRGFFRNNGEEFMEYIEIPIQVT